MTAILQTFLKIGLCLLIKANDAFLRLIAVVFILHSNHSFTTLIIALGWVTLPLLLALVYLV